MFNSNENIINCWQQTIYKRKQSALPS